MFIKKIVSWISENPPEGSFNETVMDQSEKSFGESTETIQVGDNWSSTSTGEKTSTLTGSLVEENQIDIQRYNKDKREENLFADGDSGSESLTVSDKTDDNAQTGAKKEKTDYNEIIREKVSLIRNSFADVNFVNDVNLKRSTADVTTKLCSVSNYESQPSFLKTASGYEHYSASDNRCPKSIFTQTEIAGDKQCDIIAVKKSNNLTPIVVSQQQQKNLIFPVCESSLAHYTEKHRKLENSESWYGTLFVVGCSKAVPVHLTEKMNTKYVLHKRTKTNGLIEDCRFVTSDVKQSLSANPAKHVILYPSNNNRSVVVTFKHDSLTDLFQIGRYEKYPIDFTVDDTNAQDKARHGVSRFACRISVRRDGNHEARIYAGAFNASQEISISESGLAHDYCGKMDGFTTNGVLIFKPHESCPGSWREVSVSGYIYPLRSSKMDASKRPRILEESNVLIDGTLIDLCGITLLWRTPEGLKKSPSEYYLNRLHSTLHKHSPECSLLSQNSSMLASQLQRAVKKAYVFLSCGHVIGLALSKPAENCGKGWSCPICRVIGPIKEFTIGSEPGFYFYEEVPSYAAFKPCGHVATQKTVEFWSSVDIPNHRSIQCSLCPFCGKNLNFITKYVKLILPII